jgi:FtsH-binding integral membrane protein
LQAGFRVVDQAGCRLALHSGVAEMLETIAAVFIVLWLLGLVSSYTLGGFIHALLVIAIVVILIRVIQGRRL